MSSEWKARRFWKSIEVRPADTGWEVALDGRALHTPGKLALILPTSGMAQALAVEWDAQADIIDPNTMPLTRAANSAVERVASQFADVASMLASYGDTDLLCYRAESPSDLVRAQADGWDPLIDWAATELQAPLRITHGVVPVPQDLGALIKLQAAVADLDPFGLTALHDLVTLPGSLILGLAVIRGRIDADAAHSLSRIDEEFQYLTWGRDDDADAASAARLAAMRNSQLFWQLGRAA